MKKNTPMTAAKLVDVATRLFISKGYKRTQMADITQAMGWSPAAVYRYVESKEALFDLVVRASAMSETSFSDLKLPVPTPKPGTTLRFLRETLDREGRVKSLESALRHKSVDNPEQELGNIITELYSRVARYHVGIKLLDRSSLDWPKLAQLWSGQLRGALADQLACYLKRRMDNGLLRAVPSATASARLMIETIAFFAMHRHYDPFPTPMEDKTAEDTVADALVHAYAK